MYRVVASCTLFCWQSEMHSHPRIANWTDCHETKATSTGPNCTNSQKTLNNVFTYFSFNRIVQSIHVSSIMQSSGIEQHQDIQKQRDVHGKRNKERWGEIKKKERWEMEKDEKWRKMRSEEKWEMKRDAHK